jgi:hypothetical protein
MTTIAKPTSLFKRSSFLQVLLLLVVALSILFHAIYLPRFVSFSNDGPLGSLVSNSRQMPDLVTGGWHDLNSIGVREGAPPGLALILLWVLGPVGYAKFLAPLALLILGLGAWCFFEQLKLARAAAILGAMATVLNSTFFSSACWGSVHCIAIGMSYFAMAAAAGGVGVSRWIRLALAGMALGISVCDGADLGAIFSAFVAAFIVYQKTIDNQPPTKGFIRGVFQVLVVALFALFLAAQAVSSLIGINVKGVTGVQQDTQTKEQRWDFATQWSLPKSETAGFLIPGLFGYRMDTPNGGVYWGAVGRDPAWDRYFASGKQGPAPTYSMLRFTGGGFYAGTFVVLVSVWAALQAFRKKGSVFTLEQRRLMWFFIAVIAISVPLAFGRFAPFYQFFYALPYVSTIRNPAKFIAVITWAMLVLFAFGLHGLGRRYLETGATPVTGLLTHLKSWWSRITGFDRKWALGCMAALAICILGGLIYSSSRSELVKYLGEVGFDTSFAEQIASFSFRSVGWFLVFLVVAMILMITVLSGYFVGKRAKTAVVLIALFLFIDLGRANLPWIIFVDYKEKNATNPVIDFLRNKPHEHRVAIVPSWIPQVFQLPPQVASAESYLDQLYGIEWKQHQFQFYNIQSLDIVQMPRMTENLVSYEKALQLRGQDTLHLVPRRWELTNTRYLLGVADFLELLNRGLDAGKNRFKIVMRFDIGPRPEVVRPTRLEELTAFPSTNGTYALFEFTAALPRAKLYTNWQTITNDQSTLDRLTSANFEPAQTVLVSESIAPPSSATALTNQASGIADIVSYAPKRVVLQTKADATSVLLLNDKYDADWKVRLDGKPAQLLRCNYIMRGVQLPPGNHTIEFSFEPPIDTLYVTLSAVGVGILLLGLLMWTNGRT